MGKLAPDALREVISCIKKTVEVIVPPKPGFDAGAHKISDDICIVIATDPCLGVPKEWFGWFLIHYAASDVAVFGAQPRFCTINLLGAPGTRKERFKAVMKQACAAADDVGMSIITGHTGTYGGILDLIGTCTAYGFIHKEQIITPGGAQPGDYLICTKPVGLETVVNFALTRQTLAEKLFGRERTLCLAEQISMQTCVEEALLMAKLGGVSAMHDATEGGLVAALNEIAEASHVGFQLDYEWLPLPLELQKLATHFDLSRAEVLSASSTGTLLAGVSPSRKDRIIDSLAKRGFDAKIVGVLTESKQRLIQYAGEELQFPRQAADPYAKILAEAT
ncbi:MAG TPA: hydrogenase assembly protein HupF [Anaerolineae bacterium]|nr:hydrogenase assembly protein HupF [Anaerolineae bacterium]